MKWKDKLIKKIITELKDNFKNSTAAKKIQIDSSIDFHLAVFNEPFLALVYKGEKKIESRFSKNKISPYNRVAKNDIVILKSSGGPVSGFFVAGEVYFFSNLDSGKLDHIRAKYGEKICSNYDPNFWETREDCKYATLIEVKEIFPLSPFRIEKKDRTAWSILSENKQNLLPLNDGNYKEKEG